MKNTVSQSTFGTYYKTNTNNAHENATPKIKKIWANQISPKKPGMYAGAQNNSSHNKQSWVFGI